MITQTIDLCMIPGATNPVIHVNQYDEYPGGLIFNLYEESAFEIPSGATVTINGTKPDKYGFSYTATYSGNVVTADLKQQMTAVAGNVECELRISQGSEIIGTQNFTLCVEEAALNNETIISDSDMPAIANAQLYASEAAASADEAETSADAAAGSAEAAAASAEAAAQDFSNAVKYTDIVNNGTYSGTAGEKVLDAAMGKTLTDSIDTKVAKSGDTVYGRYYIKDDDMPTTTAPSETHYSPTIQWDDADNVMAGSISTLFTDADERGFQMVSCRKINGVKKYHTLQISVDGNGAAVVHANATAWRKVLAITSVSLSGVPVTGHITNGQKRLVLSVPYPFHSGTSMTINTLSMTLRHVGGSSYVYLRSGTDGATYTALGSGQISVIANGAATRTNEIASFSVALKANWGFVITINFNYAMCINSTGTAVANNSPVSADITLSGTIS